MAPKTTIYSRRPPEPRQTRLSSRPVSFLAHRRASPPTRQKRQSTLTQFDRVRMGQAVVPSSDSDEDDDFNEYEESQPRKKPRISSKKRGPRPDRRQSTLTQKWNMNAMGEVQDSDESEDGLLMLDEEGCTDSSDPRGHTQAQAAILVSTAMYSDTDSDASPRQSRHANFRDSSDMGKTSTRPSTAGSSHPKTPSRPRRAVIPSSQTPSSLKLSGHSVKINEPDEPSPLKDRGSNRQPRSPAALERTTSPNLTSPIRPLENDYIDAHPWTAMLTITPKKVVRTTRPPLQRNATIQESATSDSDTDLVAVLSTQRKGQVVEVSNALEGVRPTRRAIQHTGFTRASGANIPDRAKRHEGQSHQVTIGLEESMTDSDLDVAGAAVDREVRSAELDLAKPEVFTVDSSPKRASQSTPPSLQGFETAPSSPVLSQAAKNHRDDTHDDQRKNAVAQDVRSDLQNPTPDPNIKSQYNANEEDEDEGYPETYPQTYDPVYAALERDAARYGRDTQFESDIEDADDENSVIAETDAGSVLGEGQDEVEIVPSSQLAEGRVQCSQELVAPLRTGSVGRKSMSVDHTVLNPGASSHEDGTKGDGVSLRPSQISTVAGDTQSQKGACYNITEKSMTGWPETLTSSPFPIPPSFTSWSQRRAGETQSSGLLDFSLPPPPPLFPSSSRIEGD